MLLLLSANFFQNQLFPKVLSVTLSECVKQLDPDQELFAKAISRRHVPGSKERDNITEFGSFAMKLNLHPENNFACHMQLYGPNIRE